MARLSRASLFLFVLFSCSKHEGGITLSQSQEIDAGILARLDGKIISEASEELARRTGQPAFMPVTEDYAVEEDFVLRGVGDDDYRLSCVLTDDGDDETCGPVENFGFLLPREHGFPSEVRSLIGAVILEWGAHRRPPPDLVPEEVRWTAANRNWHSDPSRPCTISKDTHVIHEFGEAWGHRSTTQPQIVAEVSMEVLKAAGRMRRENQMPLSHCEHLNRCLFCQRCLPVYASAAFAYTWSQALVSEAGGCVDSERGLIQDSVLLLNFAWSILSFEQAMEQNSFGITFKMVREQHQRWMLAFGACVSPHRAEFLADRVPVKYPLTAPVPGRHKHLVQALEHVEPSGYDFTLPIKFVILPFLLSQEELAQHRRRILIDAGAGGPFHSGTKPLLDMYEGAARFDEVILIEVDPGRLSVPAEYNATYNVSVWTSPLRVGTRDRRSDLLAMLEEDLQVTEEDFLVLKFDCDLGLGESSMEWGFMADLVLSKRHMALVDEVFVEMHYYHPALWMNSFSSHTMWQHFDLLRQLRQHGVAVHQWP